MKFLDTKTLSNNQLKLAGWLSIFISIITIPYSVLTIYMAITSQVNKGFELLNAVNTLLYTLGYVYVIYIFKQLLNLKYKFYAADRAIIGYIFLEVLFYIVNQLTYVNQALWVLSFILFILLGLALILQGIKLLKLKDDLFELKKVYAYWTIATGFTLASVILFPISIISSMVTQVVLGIIMLRSAD